MEKIHFNTSPDFCVDRIASKVEQMNVLETPASGDPPLSTGLTDTWAPSITDCTPSFTSPALLSLLSSSSSSSSPPSLSPPLPPSVELDGVLAEGRLVLDVYRGGAEVLPVLWGCVPERLKDLQYLRLGSEDEGALERALGVLPRLAHLRSLTIRGTHTFSLLLMCCIPLTLFCLQHKETASTTPAVTLSPVSSPLCLPLSPLSLYSFTWISRSTASRLFLPVFSLSLTFSSFCCVTMSWRFCLRVWGRWCLCRG